MPKVHSHHRRVAQGSASWWRHFCWSQTWCRRLWSVLPYSLSTPWLRRWQSVGASSQPCFMPFQMEKGSESLPLCLIWPCCPSWSCWTMGRNMEVRMCRLTSHFSLRDTFYSGSAGWDGGDPRALGFTSECPSPNPWLKNLPSTRGCCSLPPSQPLRIAFSSSRSVVGAWLQDSC